ncbi:MAG: BREX-3 system P-loop-containing protein BrxF, partial [Limnochordia bacterium]
MVPTVADRVIEKTGQALMMYHRLVLVVGSSGVGKTKVLEEISLRIAAPLVNVNLELSRRMLDLTERQRLLEL